MPVVKSRPLAELELGAGPGLQALRFCKESSLPRPEVVKQRQMCLITSFHTKAGVNMKPHVNLTPAVLGDKGHRKLQMTRRKVLTRFQPADAERSEVRVTPRQNPQKGDSPHQVPNTEHGIQAEFGQFGNKKK